MRGWLASYALLLAACNPSTDPGKVEASEDLVAKAERAAISDTDAARREAATTTPGEGPGTN